MIAAGGVPGAGAGGGADRDQTLARVAGTVGALAVAWLVFVAIVWLCGESPRAITAQLLVGTWGVPYGAGQVLYKAGVLLLTGLAVDLALRAGVFNIGVDGQLAVAGLAAATVGASMPASTPSWLALPLAALAATLAGALWAAPPAWLRARYGAHEVVSTIMMNRVADAAIGFGLARGLGLPGTARTPEVAPGARLVRLDALGLASMHGSAVSLAAPLAVGVAGLLAWWLARTRIGRETTLVGGSPLACAAERIPVARRIGVALVLSGALGGLAAVGPVLGYKGYYEQGLGAGAGFGGIAVALLARRSPVGLVLAALFFGTLEQGGLAINAHVPMEVTFVVEAVVIVAVALAGAMINGARGGAS